MLNRLKHTLKHSVIYGIGNLLVKLIGLILLPLYTSYLTTAQYGILALLETTSLFMATIFSVNISQSMMRWWADTKDEYQKKKHVFTTFLFLFISTAILNIAFQPFASNFAGWLFEDESFTVYFNILFVSVGLDILNKHIFSLLRVLEKSVVYIVVNSLKLVVILVLNIYFIVNLKLGIEGIILAQLIGHFVGFLMLIPIFLKNIVFKIDFKAMKEMLIYAIPLSFTALSMVLFNMGDRYVLKFMTSDSDVGIYSLAYRIAGFLNYFILQSFQMSFLPIAFKQYKEENSGRFFVKVTTYLTIGLTFGALGLALFASEFVKLFAPSNQEYWEAAKYVGLISFGVVLFGTRYMYALNFHFSKKTLKIPFIVIFFVAFNLLLNYLLIPKLNIYGSVISTIISTILLNAAYYYYGRKLYKIDYEIVKDYLALILGVLIYFSTFLLKDLNVWLSLSIKVLLLFVYPLIIIFGGFLEQIEKERLKQAWNKWKNPFNWKGNISKILNKNKSKPITKE